MSILQRLLGRFQWRTKKSFINGSPVEFFCDKSDSKQSPLKMLLEDAVTFDHHQLRSPENVWTTTPYPVKLRKQIEKEVGLEHDETSIILFPGQGTHFMGMGKSLAKYPRAKELFDVANEVLKVDLLKIEKISELNKYCQELIVVCSLAALEKLREERPSALEACVASAGFSLGEITALIFAGAIPLEQGIRLVSIRGAAMYAASQLCPGGMLTVTYRPEVKIGDICFKAIDHCHEEGIKDAFCTVANYLYPSCKVLAGTPKALEFIEENKSDLGVTKAKRLNVKGAFHSKGMEAAVEPFKEALSLCRIQKPEVRVISSVNAREYYNEQQIRHLLPKQIISPVKWEQVMHVLFHREEGLKFPKTFEVGPGKTLRYMLRRTNAKAWDCSFPVEV